MNSIKDAEETAIALAMVSTKAALISDSQNAIRNLLQGRI